MTKNDQDIIKMSHITTIQALAEKVGQHFYFNSLWKKPISYLETLRDDLLLIYNDNLKDSKK